MRNFKEKEFPSGEFNFAHPILLEKLDDLRDFIGYPIYPSPVKNALARFDGRKSSQHYVGDGKLSKAIDVFVNCNSFEVFIKILLSRHFKRIGVYFDTFYKNKKWVMFHLDLKDQNLVWYRDKYGYVYSTQENFYHKLICKFNQEIIKRLQ